MQKTEQQEVELAGERELGMMLGRNQAFGMIAGRCSAAQAACLREIRESKLYKQWCPDWDQFCRQYLNMARRHVEQIINLLNEFGPNYFELSQLTRVSPETYRAIQPALQDKTLHFEGEAIALIPENAARVSNAVAQLRKASNPEASKPSQWTQLEALEKRSYAIVDELVELAGSQQMPHQISIFLTGLMARLSRLRSQL